MYVRSTSVYGLRLTLTISGKGKIDVYRYQDRQALAYYATLPSLKLYEHLLKTEIDICDWEWRSTRLGRSDRERLLKHLEGLAEGEVVFFA